MLPLLSKKDEILTPLLKVMPPWITPNALSLSRLALCLPLLWFLISGLYGWAFLVFAIAAASDLLDGSLARLRRAQSNLGRMLDPTADKLLFFIPFLFLGTRTFALPLFIIVVALEVVTVLAFGAAYLAAKNLPRHRQKILEANTYGQLKFALYGGAIAALFLRPPHSFFIVLAQILLCLGILFGLGNLIYLATRRP